MKKNEKFLNLTYKILITISVISSGIYSTHAQVKQIGSELILSVSEASVIADTVKAVALASEASWSLVTCDNLTAVLKFWDGSPPGLVHSHEDAFRIYSDAEWAEQVRNWVCSARGKSGDGKSIVDSILVSVLSPEIATATMLYHAVGHDSTGVEKRHHGQILRVFRRTPSGWKIRVSMSTHISDEIVPQ